MKRIALTCPQCAMRREIVWTLEPWGRFGSWSVHCHGVRVAVTEEKTERGRHSYRRIQYWLRRQLQMATN